MTTLDEVLRITQHDMVAEAAHRRQEGRQVVRDGAMVRGGRRRRPADASRRRDPPGRPTGAGTAPILASLRSDESALDLAIPGPK